MGSNFRNIIFAAWAGTFIAGAVIFGVVERARAEEKEGLIPAYGAW